MSPLPSREKVQLREANRLAAMQASTREIRPMPDHTSRPIPTSATRKPRGKQISLACVHCKRRKTKCSGAPPPCTACQGTTLDCHFQETQQFQNRVATGKIRTLEDDLKSTKAALGELLEKIEVGDDPRLLEMINLVKRDGTSQGHDSDGQVEEMDIERLTITNTTTHTQERLRVVSGKSGRSEVMASAGRIDLPTSIGPTSTSTAHWNPLLRPVPDSDIIPSRYFRESSTTVSQTYLPSSTDLSSIYRVAHNRRVETLQNFGNMSTSAAIRANNYPEPIQQAHLAFFSNPEYLLMPVNIPDDTALGRSLTDYVKIHRQYFYSGSPANELFGNGRVIVDKLVIGDQPGPIDMLSRWACEIACFSDDFMPTPMILKYYCAFVCYRMMRWYTWPTLESYAAVPWMIKPTILQRTMPHLAAWDMLGPSPSFRDHAINKPTDIITLMTAAGAYMHWDIDKQPPYEFDPITNHYVLTHEFENFAMHPLCLFLNPELKNIWPDGAHMVEVADGKCFAKDSVMAARDLYKDQSPGEQVRDMVARFGCMQMRTG